MLVYEKMIGKKYNNFIVLNVILDKKYSNHIAKVKCFCGKITTRMAGSIKRGDIKNCGCIKKEKKLNKIKNNICKYSFLKEFRLNHPNDYQFIIKNNLKNLLKNLQVTGNLYNRAVYVYFFTKNEVYVGLTYNLKLRHKQHKNKLLKNKKIIKYKYTKYLEKNKAATLEKKLLNLYENKGFKILNSAPGGSLGGSKILKWTKLACIKDAKKYRTKSDWSKFSPSAVAISRNKGWFVECVKHMPKNKLIKSVKNLDTGKIYNSMSKACKEHDTTISAMCSALIKKVRCKGSYWAYCDKNGKIIK